LVPEHSSRPIVAVAPRYFRPTEVETLLGDPAKAKEKLGWTPRTTFKQLVGKPKSVLKKIWPLAYAEYLSRNSHA
jgi:GDP-D-mannose dehydratase